MSEHVGPESALAYLVTAKERAGFTMARGQTILYELFRLFVAARDRNKFIRRESRQDKEFHFQNWVKVQNWGEGTAHRDGTTFRAGRPEHLS